jgi:hypothetical protein
MLRYIGASVKGIYRAREHSNENYYRNRHNKTYDWIRELKTIGLKTETLIIEECRKEDLDELEKFYISYFRYIGCDLTNNSPGGRISKGWKLTHKQIEALRKRNIGRIVSLETRAKISASQLGSNHSEDHKNKISKALLGKKKSEEHKKNLRHPKSPEHRGKIAAANRSRASRIVS